jgi:hypothetical protein
MSTEGVLYVAFGGPYLLMALHSAETFRATNPGRGISIVTNIAVRPEGVIEGYDPTSDRLIVVEAEDARNREFKTSANRFTTYERTLLLDSDTVVLGALDVPFGVLSYADVLLKLDPKGQNRPWQKDEPILDLGPMGGLPTWNGGVLFFRRGEGSEDIFMRWSRGFGDRRSAYDQPALLEATLTSSARVLALDERWNCPASRFRKTGGPQGPTQILHYMTDVPAEVVAGIRRTSVRLGAEGGVPWEQFSDRVTARKHPETGTSVDVRHRRRTPWRR